VPVPTDIGDLSATASLNSPSGSDQRSQADDYLRAHAAFIAQLNAGEGTFIQDDAAAEERTVQGKLRDTVSVLDFIPPAEHAAILARTSTYDCTADLRAACLFFDGDGGTVHVPRGKYYTLTGLIALEDNVRLVGDGVASEIWTDADVEIITSANADGAFTEGLVLESLMIRCTESSSTTKYQVHWRNALLSRIDRVHVISGLPDLPGGSDIAGVWLDRKLTGVAGQGSYLNRITGSFIQNGGILLETTLGGVTDGFIDHNIIYGHACAHSLKFTGSCGNWVIANNQITSPPANAGIWINTATTDHLRIIGNFFDGNPGNLDPGYGIWADSGSQRVLVQGNQFWGMGKSGVRAVDPVGWVISSNGFLDNNQLDASHSDVEIVGDTFQPAKNIVANNTFQIQAARTNAGYAIEEINAGFNPVQNKFTGNQIVGDAAGYLTGGILPALTADPQASDLFLNDGFASQLGNGGDWTPVLAGSSTPGTQTYNTSLTKGKWRRQGRQVFIEGLVVLTAKDGATAGNIRITGLPFTSSATEPRGTFSLGVVSNVTLVGSMWSMFMDANTSYIRFGASGSTLAWADAVAAHIANDSAIGFSGFYFID
jgi:hypothetical protein